MVAQRHALDLRQSGSRRDGENVISDAFDGGVENGGGAEREVEDALDKIRRRFGHDEDDDVTAFEGLGDALSLGISCGLDHAQRATPGVSRRRRLSRRSGGLRRGLGGRSARRLRGRFEGGLR